jgi:UDP-2,3-diacylglucosamine hydrolase
VFVSDVHLLPSGADGADERLRRFEEFLSGTASARRAPRPEAIYVLGDLFDYWFESRGRIPPGFREACRAIRGAVDRGLRIVLLPGNRDFLQGPALREEAGVELAPHRVTLRLGAETVELSHGDELAVADRGHIHWRRFARRLTFRRVARTVPPRAAERVVAALRRTSEREKRRKPRSVMAFSEGAIGLRVARGADVVIAGHIHEPGERRVRAGGREGRLIVLGDWRLARGAYAEWEGCRVRLVE